MVLSVELQAVLDNIEVHVNFGKWLDTEGIQDIVGLALMADVEARVADNISGAC